MEYISNHILCFILFCFWNRLLLKPISSYLWFNFYSKQNLTLRRRLPGLSQMLPREDLPSRFGVPSMSISVYKQSIAPLAVKLCSSYMGRPRVWPLFYSSVKEESANKGIGWGMKTNNQLPTLDAHDSASLDRHFPLFFFHFPTNLGQNIQLVRTIVVFCHLR